MTIMTDDEKIVNILNNEETDRDMYDKIDNWVAFGLLGMLNPRVVQVYVKPLRGMG